MFARINKIQNVGKFEDSCGTGNIKLNKVNIVYANNTYGKSTLCDIIRSLKENNADIIRNRKTVPNHGDPIIQLSMIPDSGDKQYNANFNKVWSVDPLIAPLLKNLHIFDTLFIEKNVFVGSHIDRENHENFTDFVLGEGGVRIAEEIESSAKEITEQKKTLGSLSKSIKVPNSYTLSKFINLEPEFSKEALGTKIQEIKELISTDEKTTQQKEKVLGLPEPCEEQCADIQSIEELCKAIKDELSETFKLGSDDILLGHLKKCFSDTDSAKKWIQEGLKISTENNLCPFCGQSLDSVRSLIDLYSKIFDAKYSEYIDRITKTLTFNYSKFKKLQGQFAGSNILLNVNRYKTFNEFVLYKKEFEEMGSYVEELLREIGNIGIPLNTKMPAEIESAQQLIESKLKYPYKALECDLGTFIEDLKSYNKLIEDLNKKISTIKVMIADTKKSIIDDKLTERIRQNRESLEIHENQLSRIDQEKICKEYTKLKNKIDTNAEINTQRKENIFKNQNAFLSKYFAEINKLFKQFGSDDFEVEYVENNRGITPAYNLNFKFRAEVFDSSNLQYKFSESDKRALALAIFWAKIDLSDDKSDAIIILDDPITSFDDNRISSFIRLIKDDCDSLRQIIITAHYMHIVKRFSEECNESCPINIIEIIKKSDNNGVTLKEFEQRKLLDGYWQDFFILYDYANGKSNNASEAKSKVRKFMENTINYKYAKQIEDHNLRSLGLKGRLENLCKIGCFSEDVKRAFDDIRESYNPDAHEYPEKTETEIRTDINYLFSHLYQ